MRRTFLSNFERVDAVLLAGAVVGCALYFLVVPRVHPDRAVNDRAPIEEVITAARDALAWQTGVAPTDEPADVHVRRAPTLLDSLHHAYGRAETVRLAREDGIPAYYWEVIFVAREEEDDGTAAIRFGRSPDDWDEDRVSVSLTLDGRPFAMTVNTPSGNRLHTSALRALMSDSLRYALIDSVGADRWTFRFNDRVVRGGGRFRADDRDLNAPPSVEPFYLRPEARVLLNQADASALARYHLRGTFLDDFETRVDSVTTSGEGGRATATVHVASVDSTPGRRFVATLEVAPTGELIQLEPSFVRNQSEGGPGTEDVMEIIQLIAFIALAVVAFVVFLRRIRHQLVDVGAAFREGVLAALATYVALIGSVLSEIPVSFSFELLMMLFGLSLLAILAGVLIFFVSGAANSTARDVWADKLQTLDLAREAYIRNVPVGRSLLRGLGFGLTITGILCIGFAAAPAELIELSGDPLFYASSVPGTSFLIAAASEIFAVLFITYAAIVGAGALIRKKTASPALLIGGVAIVLTITHYSPLDLGFAPFEYVILAAVGLLVGWTLWRFDVLTVIVGLFAAGLLWKAAPGWVVPGTPEFVGALMSFLFVGGIAGLGALGVREGRSTDDLPVIVPEYIEELARKERLERELELARSMQLSFLPRSTPDLPGLDIASVCLPAYEVGGDYYDFFQLDDATLAFAVGDVSGTGMEAAFYMTLMKGILQSLVVDGSAPAFVLSKANDLFRRTAARSTFMSMALGVLNIDRRILTFARAGHNPLLIRRPDRLEIIKPGGLALGLADSTIFDVSIEQVRIRLEADDLFVVYTDGVTEAMNARRELYGDERLGAILSTRPETAAKGLQHIVDDVSSFTRGTPSHDDMTLLVARLTDGAHSSISS